MRAALLVAAASLGCVFTEDFARYSAQYAEVPADAAVDSEVVDSAAPEATPDGGTKLDTAPLFDSGSVDTSPGDAGADAQSCSALCEASGLKGAVECVAGKCECRGGATRCGDTCSYLDSDPLNCKTCGVAVSDSSQMCSGGTVVCAPSLRACSPWSFTYMGTTYNVSCPANAKCIDTAHHGDHCYQYSGTSVTYRQRCYSSGQIGVCHANSCAFRTTTTGGPCTGTGRRECGVVGSIPDPNVRSCVDTLRDPNHCGDCEKKCAGRDQLCAGGACARYRPARSSAECPSGSRFCTPPGFTSSVCIDGVTACPT